MYNAALFLSYPLLTSLQCQTERQRIMGTCQSQHPTEILDRICSFIVEPSTLLNVGLTSKQLCAVAIPGHLEFRVIRCDWRRIYLWEHLLKLPNLGSSITTFELITEGDQSRSIDEPVVFPKSLLSGSESDAPKDWDEAVAHERTVFTMLTISNVIRTMHSLTRFGFYVHDRPTNDIFQSLHATCKDLKEVEVLYHEYSWIDTATTLASIDLAKSPVGFHFSYLTR